MQIMKAVQQKNTQPLTSALQRDLVNIIDTSFVLCSVPQPITSSETGHFLKELGKSLSCPSRRESTIPASRPKNGKTSIRYQVLNSGRHLTTHLFHTRTCNLQSTSLTLVINIRMIQKTDTQMKQQGILGMNKVLPLELQADDLNFVSNLDNWTDSLGA